MKKILLSLLVLLPFFGFSQVCCDLTGIAAPSGSTPTLSISVTSLPNFVNNIGTASSSQTFAISGSNLTNNGLVSVPTNWEISPDGSTWTGLTSLTLTRSGTAFISQPVSVYIRVLASAPIGSYSGFVQVTSTGAATKQVAVTATVNSLSPLITLSVNTLSGFTTTFGFASAQQNYTVTGSNLTADILVTAPTGYEVSLDNITYTATVTITRSGSNASATVYTRIKNTASVGSPSGNITHTSSGATTQNLSVSGTVSAGAGAGDSARFAFALTNTTPPAGFVRVFGDPSTGSPKTGTNPAGTITISSVAIGNWAPVSGASAADNDGYNTGSTISAFPDPALYGAFYTYSGATHVADSANQTLAKPNFQITGSSIVNTSTYTIHLVGSLDASRFGLTCTNKLRVVGASTYITSTVNQLGNKTVEYVITGVVPDGSNVIKIYTNTEVGQEIFMTSAMTINR